MAFLPIAARDLLHRPVRSALTIAGVAIGVAAVVALTSIAWGFERSWERMYVARGTDLVVTKAGNLSPAPPAFVQTQLDSLRSFPEVRQTSGAMSEIMGLETASIVLVLGWEPNTFVW